MDDIFKLYFLLDQIILHGNGKGNFGNFIFIKNRGHVNANYKTKQNMQ